ncbi:type IV pilus modification protein PilV [Janthinobacterium sp.]|uniref:type IV pilus modification protein PilV n=1 Tax=Janthinobacterium sp. TaxID=1871054 RepID=UPI00293D4E29|nr:type IV pilus modification protein PilV [Janthinobacterium sp.]
MQYCRNQGFSLVEALISMLVLALGMLGGTAMQLAALRTRHQSALLSNALQLAAAMADKMRANAAEMTLDDADNPYLNQRYDAAADAAPTAPARLCFAAQPCDSAQLASADLYELKQHIRKLLPDGRLLICRDAAAGGASLSWGCDGAAKGPIVIKLGWGGRNPDGTPLRRAARADAPGVALALTAAVR